MPHRPSDARLRELGAVLREWRVRAGLQGQELARRIGWSQSHISRLESGNANITEMTVVQFLAFCGATAQDVADALQQAKETEDGYLVRRDVLRNLVLHETKSSKIRSTAPLLIPGLLQTEGYAHAVMQLPEQFSETEIASMVATRMGRQELLTRWRRPEFTYFIYEAALRSPVGDNLVMNEQMLHLAFLADRKDLAIRVVPFPRGARAACANHFTLMEFAEHGPVLYLESPFAGMFIENSDDIATARRYLHRLAGEALDGEQSRQLLAQLASEYDRPPEGVACPPVSSPH